jgi:hypothetical protein
MARKKTPVRKIAKKLRRTEGATRQKAFSMGLSLDTRARGTDATFAIRQNQPLGTTAHCSALALITSAGGICHDRALL